MKVTLDIKTLLALGTTIAILGGFYYSTQHRLNALELRVESMSSRLDTQVTQVKQLRQLVRKKTK